MQKKNPFNNNMLLVTIVGKFTSLIILYSYTTIK